MVSIKRLVERERRKVACATWRTGNMGDVKNAYAELADPTEGKKRSSMFFLVPGLPKSINHQGVLRPTWRQVHHRPAGNALGTVIRRMHVWRIRVRVLINLPSPRKPIIPSTIQLVNCTWQPSAPSTPSNLPTLSSRAFLSIHKVFRVVQRQEQ